MPLPTWTRHPYLPAAPASDFGLEAGDAQARVENGLRRPTPVLGLQRIVRALPIPGHSEWQVLALLPALLYLKYSGQYLLGSGHHIVFHLAVLQAPSWADCMCPKSDVQQLQKSDVQQLQKSCTRCKRKSRFRRKGTRSVQRRLLPAEVETWERQRRGGVL